MIFEDYVLVIDANYPSGAREVIPRIRELTKKPIRFAFDTHHHGDHAYGNQGKVYTELTGRTVPDRQAELDAERTHVAWHHGHAHAPGQ